MIDKDKQINTPWMEIVNDEPPQAFWFDIHRFRINGIEYAEWSEEFLAEFNKDKIWRHLSDS